MKPTLTILIEGYAYTDEKNIMCASPTTTLLELNGAKYLIDPGCNEPLLQQRLKDSHISTGDTSAVFLSHYHLDHILNIRLFPNTPIYDGSTQWLNDQEIPYSDFWLHPEFKILTTPGHAPEHCSLLVDTNNFGLVCIAQDVFWWEDGNQEITDVIKMLDYPDLYANDISELRKSRQKALDTSATWIVPGHGKMFRNPQEAA